MEEMGLVFSFNCRFIYIIRFYYYFVTKNNDNIVNFSISIAFSELVFNYFEFTKLGN